MLAIIEQWEAGSGARTDNTQKYLLLVVFKAALDAVVFCLCCRRLRASFLSLCGLSVVLADLALALCMAAAWLLGPERSPVSPCSLLAHTSAAFAALPLPMASLGLVDYCIEDTRAGDRSASCKFLRNAVFTSLVWTLAVAYSLVSVRAELMELDYAAGLRLMVCDVEESTLLAYFVLALFTAVVFAMLPFWSRIPQWVREADKLSESREEHEKRRSDLFTSTPPTEAKSAPENAREETIQPRPPLWFSLTLGFALFWISYLTVSVACLVLGCGVPAYISVNLLWMECTNSLLVGVVFWVKSKTLGPYSRLPGNVCLWHVYWHLSKGTWQQQLPAAVFNPSKAEIKTLLYV